MYAVIRTGGKQYRVAPDDIIEIEKIAGVAGDKVAFEDVLMLGGDGELQVGAPIVEGAAVAAELLEQKRARKIVVFKKKRRKNYRRKNGHRQELTRLRITDILTGGKKLKGAIVAGAVKPAKRVKGAGPGEKIETPAKTAKPAKKAPAKQKSEDKAKPAGGDITPLFDRPDGPADDLKLISGVGPVLEDKLNAFGVTQFAQVAAFTPDDIANLDEALNFKGRIERDDWLSQAAKLAEEKKDD